MTLLDIAQNQGCKLPLRDIIYLKGETQLHLQKLTGIDQCIISKAVNGYYRLKPAQKAALEKALDAVGGISWDA